MAKKKPSNKETAKSVETITHTEDKRKNIPTIEYRSMVREDQQSPVPVRYPRNPDLDPQLVGGEKINRIGQTWLLTRHHCTYRRRCIRKF